MISVFFQFLSSYDHLGIKLLVLFFVLKLCHECLKTMIVPFLSQERIEEEKNIAQLSTNILHARHDLEIAQTKHLVKLKQIEDIKSKIERWQRKNLKNHNALVLMAAEKLETLKKNQRERTQQITLNTQKNNARAELMTETEQLLTSYYHQKDAHIAIEKMIEKITKPQDASHEIF